MELIKEEREVVVYDIETKEIIEEINIDNISRESLLKIVIPTLMTPCCKTDSY